MSHKTIDISVIIVNYKVREYIANLLNSLYKAQQNLSLEIFVVDNASGDDSKEFLTERFPDIIFIQNNENLGFGKANNLAINQASGKHILIINPDTLVSEDTLIKMVSHMERHPKCGAAGCKILNPDGTFAPESRRTVPSIWSSSAKLLGLSSLFPKSRLFGAYYMSWLDENEPSQVPVLSGAFMFWRAEVLKSLQGFDERFFMYGEDIDLCYRIQKTSYHIDYVPATSVIHYKGESTQKDNLKYIKLFNKAMYQFYDKHYSTAYSSIFRVLIYLTIVLKTVFSFSISFIKKSKLLFLDVLLFNVALSLVYMVRFSINLSEIFEPERFRFFAVNLIVSVIYLIAASFIGSFKDKGQSLSNHLKSLIITFVGIVIISFFANQFAFSRLVLGVGFILSAALTISIRFVVTNKANTGIQRTGRIRNARILIVGDVMHVKEVVNKIHSRPDWHYEVIGTVQVEEGNVKDERSIGDVSQLSELVKAYNIDQVFFVLASISYQRMLHAINKLQNENIICKLIPESMDFILGKSNVEYLESIPLIKVEFEYSKPANRFIKRVFDVFLSLPLFLVLLITVSPSVFLSKKQKVKFNGLVFFKDGKTARWKNRLYAMAYVFSGKMSFVGSPFYQEKSNYLKYKKGITGLVQVNESKMLSIEDREQFDIYYLQNYSIWMDVDILAKSLFNRVSMADQIYKADKA